MSKKISQREAIRNRRELRLLKNRLEDMSLNYPNLIQVATISLESFPETRGRLKAARLLGKFIVATPRDNGDLVFVAADAR